jgi:hypothetical protein
MNSGWLVWIEDQTYQALRQLERCADALERIADASEQQAEEPDEEEPPT